MRLLPRQRSGRDLPGVSGTVRMDRRTSAVVRRVHPGDIAVIDHLDLDRGHAEALVESGVVAVVNASSFISGRYPTLGPEVLGRSGVVMVDAVGTEVFSRLRDGDRLRLQDGALLVGSRQVAEGQVLAADDVDALLEDARSGLTAQLSSFTHNTAEFLRREQELLLHGVGLPDLRTSVRGRPVVVVVRGFDHREDLRGLRRFIREQRPVLVGVDGGADALLEAGHRVDLVVGGDAALAATAAPGQGDRTVSDAALSGAGEVVVHTDRDRTGRPTSVDRLGRLGLDHAVVAASGATEDIALLLADAGGASLVVTVGTRTGLDDLLDNGRGGLPSTFLTRLRVGAKLVDAKGVPALYAGRVRLWQLLLVLLVGLLALGVALASTPVGHQWWSSAGEPLQTAVSRVRDWIEGLL